MEGPKKISQFDPAESFSADDFISGIKKVADSEYRNVKIPRSVIDSLYYRASNPSNYISGITKAMVENALTGNEITSHYHDGRYYTKTQADTQYATVTHNHHSDYIAISQKAVANGVATLDAGAKIPIAQIPDSVVGQVEYKGTWNASTNTPTLPSTPAERGHYYVVSAAGTQFGLAFSVGDWVISNGTAWEKVDNTDAVMTVFGRLGNVVANESDYSSFFYTKSQADAKYAPTVHNHDSLYYTETELSTSGAAAVHFGNLTSLPSTLAGHGITNAYTKTEADARYAAFTHNHDGDYATASHTHTFASLTSKPTTLSGYGITDAASSTHTHTFASLTSKPTTLAGYGITDAAAASHTHTFASITSKPTTLSGYGITDALTEAQGNILYALVAHNHSGVYAPASHTHGTADISDLSSYASFTNYYTKTVADARYAAFVHNHDGDYASASHNHDSTYLKLAGGTLTGKLTLNNSTSIAPINIPRNGTTNPTTTVSGDLWYRSNNLYYNDEGTVRAVAHTGSWAAMSVAEGQTATATTSRFVRADYLKQIIEYHGDNKYSLLGHTHSDYLTESMANTLYALVAHNHSGTYAPASHSHTTSNITDLSSYASFTNYYTKTVADARYAAFTHNHDGDYATASHTHTFASITSKPTTLLGYGITDGVTGTGTAGQISYWNGTGSQAGSANLVWDNNLKVRGDAAIRFDRTASGFTGIEWWGTDSNQTAFKAAIRNIDSASFRRTGIGFYTSDIADWTTEAKSRMSILRNGNVLIGTTTDRSARQVVAAGYISPTSVALGSGEYYVGLYTWSTGAYGLGIHVNESGRTYIQNQRYDANTATYDICLQPLGGAVAIGKTSVTSGYMLDVNGAMQCTGIKATNLSDGILKSTTGLISKATAADIEASHTHADYLTEANANNLYALVAHNHTGVYAPASHTHGTADISDLSSYASFTNYYTKTVADARYAAFSHNHDGDYATASHNHTGVYATVSHTHGTADITNLSSYASFSNYYTKTDADGRYLYRTAELVEISSNTTISSTNQSTYNGKVIYVNSSDSRTLTFDTNLSTGFQCTIIRYGTGDVTIAAQGTGGVIRSSLLKKKIKEQYEGATIVKLNSTEFILMGALKS